MTAASRAFAWWYPRMMRRVETAGHARLRRDLLTRARGATLEVGAGTGLAYPHYPAGLEELVLVEPALPMRRQLEELVATTPRTARSVSVVDGDVYRLPFPDGAFDTVAASLLFCSLDRPHDALAELARVLRPGGVFLFHEHVRGTGLRRVVQRLLSPLQRRIADGCRPTQDFEAVLAGSPFRVARVDRVLMPKGPYPIKPLVLGEARIGH